MLLSTINNLLNKGITLLDFNKQIESEVSNYKKILSKEGSSSPIHLIEDMDNVAIKQKDVKFLFL